MRIEKPSFINPLINGAAFMIIVAGLHSASSLVVRFLLALFIAFICGPLFFWFHRKGVPKSLAMIIVLLVIVCFMLVIGIFIGTSVNDFTRTWPTYQANFTKIVGQTLSWLEEKGIDIPRETVLEVFNPGTIMNLVGSMLTGLTGMFSDTFLILITVIFVLLEASGVPLKVAKIWGKDSSTMSELNRFALVMQRYIALKTIISMATGLFAAISLTILGVDFPLLWGLLAFLLNYVPTIGSILASIPPILLAFIQFGWGKAAIVLIIYLTINMAIGNIIEPRTMGKGLGLSTLIVFISVVFWGWILGPIGMLLSVPLTMSIKIYMESRESTRWMAIILGPSIPKDE